MWLVVNIQIFGRHVVQVGKIMGDFTGDGPYGVLMVCAPNALSKEVNGQL